MINALREKVAPFVSRLEQAGIKVSLFIDPDEKQIDASRRLGVSAIELHTGAFADAKDQSERERQLERITTAVLIGEAAGLRVNAGHGLNYKNVDAHFGRVFPIIFSSAVGCLFVASFSAGPGLCRAAGLCHFWDDQACNEVRDFLFASHFVGIGDMDTTSKMSIGPDGWSLRALLRRGLLPP